MHKDTLELDLPPDTDHALALDPQLVELTLIEERKRFDEERQQLRQQITALVRQNAERDQQAAMVIEQEKARVQQDNVQLTSELFAVRRQLQEVQKKQQAENERLLAEARQQAAEAAEEKTALQARVQELEAALAELRRPMDRPRSEPVAMLRPKPAAAPAAPASPVQELTNSYHRSGNPIPVLVHPDREDPDDAVSGWVLERSLGGLTLLLDQELPAGAVLRVKNGRPTCTRPSWVSVQVKACRAQGNSFQICCRYPQQPTWEEMQQFW